MAEKYSIAVDTEFLASRFGLKAWPDYVPLENWRRRAAARVITDALRPRDNDALPKPEVGIFNAEHWIDYAYEQGKRAGRDLERSEWTDRIRKLFGLEGR